MANNTGRGNFKKGHQRAKGGKRKGAGRPTNAQLEAKKMGADLAKKYMEGNMKPVMDAYLSLATGQQVGKTRRKLDPATCRHAVERFIGQAPRTLVLDFHESIEDFFAKVAEHGARKRAEARRIGESGA